MQNLVAVSPHCTSPHVGGPGRCRKHRIGRRVTMPNLVTLDDVAPQFGMGRDWPQEIRLSSIAYMCYHVEFGRSRSNHTSVIMEIRQKNFPSRPAFQDYARSLESTIDTDRSATMTFIVSMGLSRNFSVINGDFGKICEFRPKSKFANFSYP